MLNKIALCVAIVLGTGFTASATTRHHRVSHVPQQYYNAVPGDYCPTDGTPCRINGDDW
jgi:hypothetical protein